MSGDSSINIMMIVFSITTVAVFLYPIIRLTPSWLERSLNKKIAFHRAAATALGSAMARSHNDQVQFARLSAQHDFHRSALANLVPHETVAEAPVAPRKVDAA